MAQRQSPSPQMQSPEPPAELIRRQEGQQQQQNQQSEQQLNPQQALQQIRTDIFKTEPVKNYLSQKNLYNVARNIIDQIECSLQYAQENG